MKDWLKNIFKAILLLVIIFSSFFLLNKTYVFFESTHNMTTWNSFYRLPKDTLDIVHIGSSHNDNGIVTVVESKILELDTYTIGSEAGSIDSTPYYLKEVFKTQKPKIVTLELFTLLKYDGGSRESFRVHKAFDGMHMSLNKIQGILDNKPEDDPLIEYILPFTLYHENWKKVEHYITDDQRKTFNPFDNCEYNGYWFNNQLDGKVANDPLLAQRDVTDEILPLDPDRYELLDEIVQICNENGSKLVLLMIPYTEQASLPASTLIKYVNGLKEYAQNNEIDILDYQMITEGAGICKSHTSDPGHLNVTGAYQLTTWLADYFLNQYSDILQDCSWDLKEQTLAKYEQFIPAYDLFVVAKERMMMEYRINYLSYPDNLPEYLEYLKDDLYIAIITTNNSSNMFVDDAVIEALQSLGLSAPIETGVESSYIALVISGQAQLERMDTGPVGISNDEQHIQNLALPFTLNAESGGSNVGNTSYVKIDGIDIPVDADGFNIVVFDGFLKKVVNVANFNTNGLKQRTIKSVLTEQRFNQGTLAYVLDMSKPIAGLEGTSGSKVVDDGIQIGVNSIDPRFYLNDFIPEHTHIGIKVEIECPVATIFETMFNGSTSRAQLVKGYNTVYLELEASHAGGCLRIDPACIEGEYILNSLEIVYLD